MMKRCVLLILMLAMLAMAGCSSDPEDPEQQLRAVVAAAKEAAEDRSTRGIMRHVSEDYRDAQGRDREALRQLVRAWLLQHQNPRILTRVREIEFVTSVRAELRLLAGLADTGGGRFQADAYELLLTLEREADETWRVIRAEWRQAGRNVDFE